MMLVGRGVYSQLAGFVGDKAVGGSWCVESVGWVGGR